MTNLTVVLERNTVARGELVTEPYEAGWAHEAIFFIHSLDELHSDWTAQVQISADGLTWCDLDDGGENLKRTGVTPLRINNFGTWLRLVLRARDTEDRLRCLVTFTGKGSSW